MAVRVGRSLAIGCGIAAVAGGGIGFAVGEPVTPADVVPARSMAADLCARIGDVAPLLPKAPNAEPVLMTQSGSTSITCEAASGGARVQGYTAASIRVTITAYGGQEAGAGHDPLPPEQIARKTLNRSPMNSLPNRPYPTKASRTETGKAGETWSVRVLVQRADVVVGVTYAANPITADVAQTAAIALADRAIWESK